MTIGDKVRSIATKKKITPYRIAKDGKISNSYISDLINNKQTNPSIGIVKKIAKVLDVSVDELIN